MTPTRIPLALAALAWLAAPPPAAAQEPVPVEHAVSLGYSTAHFDAALDPWHLATVELRRRSAFGALLARASVARRFGETGQQYEAEAYPRLGDRAYAYLNLGWSPSGLFPERHYGAEVFGTVAPGWELSAGGRRLDFEAEEVTLYTLFRRHVPGPLVPVRAPLRLPARGRAPPLRHPAGPPLPRHGGRVAGALPRRRRGALRRGDRLRPAAPACIARGAERTPRAHPHLRRALVRRRGVGGAPRRGGTAARHGGRGSGGPVLNGPTSADRPVARRAGRRARG